MRLLTSVLVAALVALGLPIVPLVITATPARAAGPCTRTWALDGGTFSDAQFGAASSWDENASPTETDTICFPTGTVTFFGAVRTVAAISVAPGATLVLRAGVVDLTSASELGGVFLSDGAQINAGGNLTVSAGRVAGAVDGQIGVIASTTGAVLDIEGEFRRNEGNTFVFDLDVVNDGTLHVTNGGGLRLGAGRTFTNNGLISGGPGMNFESPAAARFHNLGVVEFVGQDAGPDSTGSRSAVQFDNDGLVRVLSGDVALVANGTGSGDWEIGTSGSGSCAAPIGDTPNPGARLFFRSDAGFTFTGGSVGGPGCANVSQGSVSVAAGVAWAPGATEVFGSLLTLEGDRTLPQLRVGGGGEVSIVNGTATAGGPISQTSPQQAVQLGGDGTLVVPSGIPFVHEGGNSFRVRSSLDLILEGSASVTNIEVLNSARLINQGALSIGPGARINIEPGAELRNEGDVTVDAGTGTVPIIGKGIDNVGTFRLARGTIDMRAPFAQMTGASLTAGRIEVASGTLWIFFPVVTTLAGQLRLEGTAHLDASFATSEPSLRLLTTITPTGALELADGADLAVLNGLTNNGRLEMSGASALSAASYTQGGSATLAVEVGAASGVVSAPTATLSGVLALSPAVGQSAAVVGRTVVDATNLVGTFDSVTSSDGGPVAVTYDGGDARFDYRPGAAPASADLSVTLDGPVTVPVGTTAAYTATVRNDGPDAASGVQVRFASAVAIDDATFGGDPCVPDGADWICTIGGLGVNDTAAASVEIVPAVAGPFSVQVTVLGGGDDPDNADRVASTSTFAEAQSEPIAPRVITQSASVVEGSGGGLAPRHVSITVENPNAVPVSLSWTGAGVTAILDASLPGNDAVVAPGSTLLDPGVTVVDIPFETVADSVAEPDEAFSLAFSPGGATATVTISNDDEPVFEVSLSSSGLYREDSGEISLNLRLDRVLPIPVTFDLRTIDGTAEAPEDYVALDDQITIPAGQTEGPFVRVTIVDDTQAYELDREVFAVVAARDGVDLAGTSVTVIDDDTDAQARFVRSPSVSQTSPLRQSLVEGNTSNATMPLSVELTAPITAPTSVSITVDSTTADRGVDYELSVDALVFLPGDGPKVVTVTSLADTELELDDELQLALHTESGDLVRRIDDLAEVTLVDDDQSLTLTPSVASRVGEGSGTVVVTVTADHAPGEFVTIPVSVAAVSASPGSDYAEGLPGSLTLRPTDTEASFEVSIVDDSKPEPDEVFRVALGTPTQGKAIPSSRDVTIVDDDPAPFTLSLGDVSVDEGGVARLTLTVTPTQAGGSGSVVIPASTLAGTATRNEDFFTATGTEGTVAVPVSGGSVTLFALTGNDDRFELPETFTVAVGRPQVPGERVTATVTILDNDSEPAVTISAAGPYSEHAGEISLNLRLERAAGAPLTYRVHTVDGTAQAAEDYVPLDKDVTIPAGQTEGPFVRVEILDDALAYELDSEFFSVVVERSGFDNAVADVEIIDDDNIPQARFVRQPADPANQVLKRDLVEGTTSSPTLPLSVVLTGAAITQPIAVTLTAQSFTADQGTDFTLAPTTLVFAPGDGPKTVTLTSIGDSEVELDDVVVVSMSTEAGDLLGRVDDEAQVTLLDDDDTVAADPAVDDFRSGWLDLLGQINGWLSQFNLAPPDAQAVVTPSLADFFGLPGLGDLGLPSPDPSAHTLAELCADLLAKGVAVEYVAGGLCGRPSAPIAGDIIQIRTTVTLADLAKAAGFTGGPLNEASEGALQSLATALGLDATGGWVGDLTVTLVVGVDADGFYVSADTDLALAVGGTLTLGGTATAAGSPITVGGTATAELTVSLAPSTARQRDLTALLVPTIDGDASVTLGFAGLPVGDYTLGGDLTLGFVDGSFVPSLGGGVTVDGPPDSIVSGADVSLSGSLTAGDPTVIDVAGSVTLSGELPAGVEVEDLELKVGVLFSFGSGGFAIEPRFEKADVGAVTFPFGDILALRAENVTVDFAPPPGGNFLEVGEAREGLSVEFGDAFPVLAGWEGSFHNVALGADLVPRLLPNFGFDITPADGERFGLPEFIPLVVRKVGITFPDVVTDPPAGGLALTPALLAGMRLRISGGIEANATWPIGAEVDGLEVDLGKLTSTPPEFPITNLSGVSMGVEPFDLPGGVTIGGGLKLGTIDVDGKTVFYGRVFGDFSVADIGGGADLVVTQYGPVLMKVRAPLGIPLGPSGVVLAGVEGAAQFGSVGIPVPSVGDPVALLNNFTLPTDLTITDDVIREAVRPAVSDETGKKYTWDKGFALSLAGDLIVAAAPGILKGRATIGMNLGLPEGPHDPPGLQLVGKGEVTAFGIPLGQVGMLIDFSKPLEPSFDLAFASPVPGSPIALVVPAQATFGVQLHTDGVVLGTIEGLRVFVTELLDGSLTAGQELFGAVIDELARRLDESTSRSRPLVKLLLDLDGDGAVSTDEASRIIDGDFLLDRLVGRDGLPALLPATVSGAAFDRAARAATALMNELLLVTGDVLADPTTFGTFLIDAGAGGAGFEDLSGQAGDALAALAGVVRDATGDALAAFGDRFNPTFTINGALQQTFLGLPVGAPALGGKLFLDRTGLFFELQGSLSELSKLQMEAKFPLAAPLIDAALTAATFGIGDQFAIGARLPFGGIIDSLLGGNDLPTFQPLDPNWAVTIDGELDVLGFEAAELSGIAFLPGQQTFIDSRIQKLFALPPGTPVAEDLIPITTQAHYDALLKYGGILVTGSLRAPRLITNPAEQLALLPPPPENPLEFPAWLDALAAAATETETPARIQWFVPGIANVLDDQQATDWASSFYLEGVWDDELLGLDVGQATMNLTPEGLDVTGTFPLVGVTGTATLNTALLDSKKSLPTAGLDIALDEPNIASTLATLGVPSVFTPPSGATGHFKAFTPGFDAHSSDVVKRNGGIAVTTTLAAAGFIHDADFNLALSPRPGGFDVVGTASVGSIELVHGVVITDATVTIRVINGVASVRVQGDADVLGAHATVDGVLNGDLTGSLTFTGSGGVLQMGGATIDGESVLTITRLNGDLKASLGVVGTARLPSWLAGVAGTAGVSAAACVDSVGNMEAVLALPALNVGPDGLVSLGRNNLQAALPAGPAACAIPAGAPRQPATGPLVAWRVTGGVPSLVLDGQLQFNAPNAAIAGLTVTGILDGTNGTGSLAVAFAGGSMNLGGFSVAGSATLTLGDSGGRPTLAMTVNGGRLSVPGLLTNATVSGSANQNGITSLSVGVTGFTLPVVHIDSSTLSLVRVANTSTYQISAGLQVDVPGVANNLAVNGSFGPNGNGSLAMTVTSLVIRSASITNGSFVLVKTGSGMALRASGTFTLFGVALEVVQADLALTTTTITGNLTIRPFGGGSLNLGGWTIGGTLRLAFAGSTVTIEIDNGTVAIQGWGGAIDMDGSFSVPPTNGSSFTLSLPTGGLRLGASPSPFYATGTFKLSFTNNVGMLSVLNATLRWKDGATTIASVGVPSLSISTNGAVAATPLGSFGATLGSFSFTVPSVSLKIEPQGLNVALTLGAGSLSIPGLPTQTTPGFTLSTTTFTLTLASSNMDLGVVSLQGALIFRRTGGVFKLSVQGHSTRPLGPIEPAVFSIDGLVDVKMQDLTIASDGSYAIDVAMPRFGGSDIGVVNGRLQVNRTAGPNGSFSASISGARLLVGLGQPIPLGSLTFDTNSRFDKTFAVPAVALGPYFRMSAAQMRLRHMASGIVRADLVNPVNVAVLDGSGTLTLNDLRIETDGTFIGSVTGRLALFGTKITSTTFDVRRQNGIIELRLAGSAGETLSLGFGHQISMSGEARSDGTFSFSGSMKVALDVSGFSIDGSADVTVATGGIDGSASGSVCIIQCATASGNLRSDGRIRGSLVIPNVVNADWRVYLKTEGVRVDLNRDGDTDDIGDISIGDTTSADDTAPSMPTPSNVTVNANIGSGGQVRVYYVVPVASESNVDVPARCTPPPGSLFGVGATTVTCRATDENGNVRTRTFTVTVVANPSAAVPTATAGATALVESPGYQPGSLLTP